MYEKPEYLKNGPRKYEEEAALAQEEDEMAEGLEQERVQELPQAKVGVPSFLDEQFIHSKLKSFKSIEFQLKERDLSASLESSDDSSVSSSEERELNEYLQQLYSF